MNSSGGIAVVYAPNGTGKSSLAKVLKGTANDLSFSATNDDGALVASDAFHIIPDQIDRNVIRGKETDYLVGQQIRREYELRDRINSAFVSAYAALSGMYKSEFKVDKVGDYLLTQIGTLQEQPYPNAFSFLRSIINTRSHGKDIDQVEFISFIRDVDNKPQLIELDAEKRTWVIADCSGKSKIVKRIIDLDHRTIVANQDTIQIERQDDAISILKKYHSLETCIVCDNHDFHGDDLLTRKQDSRNRIYDGLDQGTKELLDKVVRDTSLLSSDPFDIRRIVSEFIAGGEATELLILQNNLMTYVHSIGDEMIDRLFHCFDQTPLFQYFDEYTALVATQPELDSEELLFIEEIINENIGKDIIIERDPDSKNYKLKLGDKNLIGTDRSASLSGEHIVCIDKVVSQLRYFGRSSVIR